MIMMLISLNNPTLYHQSTASVQLKSTVYCYKADNFNGSDQFEESIDEYSKKLDYFELDRLCKAKPQMFSDNMRRNLTPKQTLERNTWSREGAQDVTDFENYLPILVYQTNLDPKPQPKKTSSFAQETLHEVAIANLTTPSETLSSEDNQKAVIEAPVDQSLIVEAPPGTGKTFCLIQRVANLISLGSLTPSEVLILSFTRPTVAEIYSRLKAEASTYEYLDDLNYIDVATFDSFATRILTNAGIDNLEQGYSKRIEQFTKSLDKEPVIELLSNIKVLFIDEIQDLNNERALMALSLIDLVLRNGGSVTLLGDRHQAIYDWDDSNKHNSFSSNDFRETLEKRYQDIFILKSLSKTYRYHNRQIKELVGELYQSMGGATGETKAKGTFFRTINRLPKGNLESLSKNKNEQKTAILTRKNMQAVEITNFLKANNINASLYKGRRGKPWPAWLALLIKDYQSDYLDIELAEARYNRFKLEKSGLSFDDAWEFLKAENLIKDYHLDLEFLNREISRRTPISLVEQNGIIVSTIHKVKGLEFENVYVYEMEQDDLINDDEVSVLYVAATRAKEELKILERHKKVRVSWQKRVGRNGAELNHYLLNSSKKCIYLDGEYEVEPESIADFGESWSKNQEVLWNDYLNQQLVLKVEPNPKDRKYYFHLGAQPIFKASPELNRDLHAIKSYEKHCGKEIDWEDISINDLATIALPLKPEWQRQFGRACLVLVPCFDNIVKQI